MRPLGKGAYLKALVVVWLALVPRASAFQFDDLEGTVYGLGVNSPGDVVLEEDRMRMSVENFVLGGNDYFYYAEVVGPGPFPSPSLELDNISVRFDFSDARFAVDTVFIPFADFGGASNLAVNDDTLFVLDAFWDIPLNVAPGVTATLHSEPGLDLLILNGPIQSVLVGGQELFIESVTAIPEPTTGVLMTIALLALLRRRRAA